MDKQDTASVQPSGRFRSFVHGMRARAVALIFAVGTLINAGVTTAVTTYVNEYYADKRAQQEKVEKAVASFREEANRFDTLSLKFVSFLAEDDKVNSEARQQLLENLVRQHRLLSEAARFIPVDMQRPMAEYDAAVRALSLEIPQVQGVLDAAGYWQCANGFAVARNNLFNRLEQLGV